MAGILGSTPVSTSQIYNIGGYADAGVILDYLFQKNAVILNDTLQILTGNSLNVPIPIVGDVSVSLPIPLIGFEFLAPEEVELLKYSYSEYPYIDKTMLTNAYIKENTKLSIVGVRPITHMPNGNHSIDKNDSSKSARNVAAINNASTSVVGNYISNELILSTLQAYCDRGGTFTVLTMWGQINNLVLERLSGIKLEGGQNQFAGQGYKFEFKRVQFPKKSNQGIRNTLSKLTLGIL